MRVYVTSYSGISLPIACSNDDTVIQLNEKIASEIGIPCGNVHLSYQTKRLECNGKSLREYNITDESNISMSLFILGGSSEVKAVVSEENGEISCSVEETNRIRALLGLKPLNDSRVSKEEQEVRNFRKIQDDQKRIKDAEELRLKIEKAKTKRMLSESLVEKKLSVVDEEDESLLTAADWVKRSRIKALETEKDPKPAPLKRKIFNDSEESTYSSEDLKGLKVMNSMKDLKEGEEVILTLADSSILKRDERGRIIGVADDEDVLENIHMTEEDKRLERERKKKRSLQPVYSAYDDDEFNGVAVGAKPSILSHYDKDEKSGPKFAIGVGDINVKPNVPLFPDKGPSQSLAMAVQSSDSNTDFLTAEEYAMTFKKRNTDKSKKLRRKKNDDDNEDNEANLDAILSSSKQSESTSDRGSRKTVSRTDAALEEQKKRQEGYEKAKKASQDQVKQAFSTKKPVQEVDVIIKESTERLNRISSEPKSITEDRGAQRVLEILQKQKELKEQKRVDIIESKMDDDISNEILSGLDAEGRRKDGTLVFSSTTEFTARLQALLNEQARSQTEKAMADEDKHVKNKKSELASSLVGESAEENDDRIHASNDMDIEDVDDDEEDDDSADNMDVDDLDDDQIDEFLNQPMASSSIGAALALLKSSGELKAREHLAGRAKDTRDHEVIDPNKPELKIEYRDEYGRALTKKEAFRQLCYRFHGYGPGKKKKDKRIKAMKDERKAGTSLNATDSITMKSLERAQEATGKAHITIQGGTSTSSNAATLKELAAQMIEKEKRKKEAAKKKK